MKTGWTLTAITMALVAQGCATPLGSASLRLSQERPLDNQSVLAPDLAGKHYRKLIVVASPHELKHEGAELEGVVREALEFAKKKEVPPPPLEHPSAANVAANVERGLLKAGVALISADVAGRATASDKDASRGERLIALGKATGADAILEVVEYVWEPEARGRWFIYDPEKNTFEETDAPTYDTKSRTRRWSFNGPELRVAARLVDAQGGAVEAEFHMTCNALWNLPSPYAQEMAIFAHSDMERVHESYGLHVAMKAGRETCLERITKTIADSFAHP